MAKRFYSDLINLRNETFTIEVWDTDFVGAASTFNPGADGFSLSYKGDNNERTGTVLATECAVQFRLETTDHETFQTDIIGSKEGRFTLRITKGTGTPTLFWVGLIITDVGGYEEAYHPFFTLRAVDGLGLLKDVEYKDGANFYTGKASLKDHLINALTHLEYVDTHFAVSDRFLRVAVDWWEETMTNNTTNDPLALTYVDHSVWYVYEKNVQEARSCREVIDNILRVFGARITMHEGVFWVEQITYRTAATIVLRSYDKAGTYLSSNNFSSQNTINQTANGALFTGGVYEFFAPLSEAVHTFEVGLRQNHLAGQSFSSGVTSNVTINKPIEANSGATTLRLTGNITLSLFNQSYTGNATIPRFALFKCTLKIGTYYLKRTYTVQNYQVVFGAMSWETTAQNFYLSVEMPNGVPASGSGNTYNYSQWQDITTPPLPAGDDSFQFGMIWELITQADITQFLKSFNFLQQWLEPYSYGNPDLNDDEWGYEAENPDVENTLIHETTCLIGGSTDPNATGALWVKPASTYILADDWGDGVDTPDREIEKLNVQLVLGGQQKPIRRLSGTLYGPLSLLGRVVWQSANWLLLGGTYDAANAQMSGEWFELDYDGAGLTTSGPIRYKKQGPYFPEYPGSGNDTGKAGYKTQSAPPGTLLYPVATTKTLDNLAAGAITNIDITDILAAGDFYAGDTVVILNPITGYFDELDVTVTSSGGDDFITVTGTLTGDYPPDSPIIKKPLIGHPSVFGSGTANRLAYWVDADELGAVAAGTSGNLLISQGASLATWLAPVANRVMYGDGTGVAQSANLTFDGTLLTVTGKQLWAVGGSYSTSQTFASMTGTVTSTANSLTHYGLRIAPVFSNDGTLTGQGYYAANFEPSISGNTSTNNFAAFRANASSSSANVVAFYGNYSTISEGYNTSSLSNRIALRGEALFTGSGDFHTVHGVKADVSASSTGRWLVGYGAQLNLTNVKTAQGLEVQVTNNRGTANTQRGIRILTDVSGSGVVVDNTYGIELRSSAASSGLITNYYGIYQNTIPSGATQTYFIYGSQASAKSYHAGNFGIGSGTTTPAQTLHVAGTMRLTGSDGTATTIMGRDADGDVSAITVSTGLSLAGNVLTATGGGTNYQTLRDDGVAATQRANANFVSGSEIAFTLTDDAVNTETEITAALATNAVGNTKFRQSAGLSVVGRSANTTGDVADITAGSDFQVLRRSGTSIGFGSVNLASTNAVTGTLPVANGGTGAATLASDSVLTGNGTSAIVAETNLTFNSSGQLMIGTGTPAAFLNVFTGALSGAQEFIRMSGNINGNMIMSHLNASNASTAANSIYQISVGGDSAGDPCIQFTVSGATSHAFGVDNSDADKIKLTPGASVPGGTANRGLIVTNATTAAVGINRDAPTQALDVAGLMRAQGIVGESGSPSVSFSTGAGTGPANNGLSGGSVFLDFTFTTGTAPTTNGNIFTITLPFTLPIGACPVWSPGNAQTATDLNKFYRSTGSTNSFTIQANGTLAASTQYRLFFAILSTS